MSTHYCDYDKHYEYGYLEPERGETIRFDEVAVAAVEEAWREAFPPPCDHKWVPFHFTVPDGLIHIVSPIYETISVKCVECGEERNIHKQEVKDGQGA